MKAPRPTPGLTTMVCLFPCVGLQATDFQTMSKTGTNYA